MRISHSACQKYLSCPFSYFLHYYRKLRPTTESSALSFGNCVDLGLNYLLETRDCEKAVEVFQIAWKKVNPKAIKYSKADLQEELVETLTQDVLLDSFSSLFAKGEILIKEYNTQVMPRLKEVIKVQIDDEMENNAGDKLVIKTDFIARYEDGRVILFDNKTSSVKYENDSVKNSEQLGVYYEALKEEYKIDACGYIVIPKKINKKKKPAVQISIIIDTIPEEIIDKTMTQFETVLENIKQAHFPKNEKNCFNVYGKCPYYNYCHEGSLDGLKEKEDK